MKKELICSVAPIIAETPDLLQKEIRKHLGVDSTKIFSFKIRKKSIDARPKLPVINLTIDVYFDEEIPQFQFKNNYQNISKAEAVLIVGAGPGGLFAALRFIELGYKPIIFERGKDVRARRRDLAAINKEHIVNPDSNYCFGEGGAGTYSDGKLYTRSKKRGDVQRILEILVEHGATEQILVDAHPHIGTNKLPHVITKIREKIIACGGEIHFETKVTDLIIEKGELIGLITNGNELHKGKGVVLATGHSARDIFDILIKNKVTIQAKPFALGVRVEHQQALIDQIQYHCQGNRGDYLPAAPYALVEQTLFNGVQRGVFSFCMCPGGFIVPSATQQEEVVVNGMSPSRRDSTFANSGIVVAVELEDLKSYQHHGVLAALAFQKEIEHKAWIAGGKTQAAPAQRLVDFVQRKKSNSLLKTSYQPGLVSTEMDQIFPDFIAERLRQGFIGFGKKMRGFLTNEAQIVGVESRTSSPVQIPRDKETFEHLTLKRLYPCGEGAGYAGGIVSAAMDGERCAEKWAEKYGKLK